MGEEALLQMPPPSRISFLVSFLSMAKVHVLVETEEPHELMTSLGYRVRLWVLGFGFSKHAL